MRHALAVIFCLGFAGYAVAAPETEAPTLHIAQGMITGTREDAIAVFKNIPYAAPPIGRLRWRAPQPPQHWGGMRDAALFGPACPQNIAGGLMARVQMAQSEDCLSLNVWTPDTKPGARLPVMVWIYGGGFDQGASAIPLYDGTDLAAHGVVVVSLNYRLGLLGFLAHPALSAEHKDEPPANFGLMDQVAALRWVKQNIASFGGDPDQVTIFGESAGAISVDALIAAPPARGLFVRAIAQSGPVWFSSKSLADAEKAGTEFSAGTGADTPEKMRALTVTQILADQGKAQMDFGPVIDGKFLPQDIGVAFAKGEIAKVALIEGSNSNESTVFANATAQGLIDALGEDAAAARPIYEAGGKLSDLEFGRQAFDDALFAAPAASLAGLMGKAGGPSYVYHFAYLAPMRRGRVPGVGHGVEMAYVFGFRGANRIALRLGDEEQAVVAMMQSYWTNFARTGNPNGPGLPDWPLFAGSAPPTLLIDQVTRPVPDFRKDQIELSRKRWSRLTGTAFAN